MRSSLALSLLALEASAVAVAAQRVVGIDFEKRPKNVDRALRKRQGPIMETLTNEGYLYFANVSVGTPPQPISLQIDTGSSDVWMSSSQADFREGAVADGGTFNQAASSTYKALSSPAFNITYVDGTGSTGNYFTDQFIIAGTTLNNLEMGLATDTTIGTGIMGVGFDNDEAVCRTIPCNSYPSVIDQLVTQKKINSKAYSLWLNDLDANTGSILFGGVDTDKYMGNLIALPIQIDSETGVIDSFTIAWTAFSITTKQGTQSYPLSSSSSSAQAAILDSGTSLTLVPDSLAAVLIKQVAATYNDQAQGYIAQCSLGSTGATFNFQFGGTSGPTIMVPVSEMLIPLQTTTGAPATNSKGQQICQFGIEPAGDRPILLGDTFLRSAYVVYDLDNRQLSLAQTDFNSTTSNVREIAAGANGVPGVSATATGAAAAQTATAGQVHGGTAVAATVAQTAGSGVFTGLAPLAATTGTGSTSGSGAGPAPQLLMGFPSVITTGLVAALAGMGALMVLL